MAEKTFSKIIKEPLFKKYSSKDIDQVQDVRYIS